MTQRPKTHTLRIEVPLHLDEGETFHYDPVAQALQVVMAVSRLATDRFLCDDITVTLDESTQ